MGPNFLNFVRKHAYDRQTDEQKGLGSTVHCIMCCITWSHMVKKMSLCVGVCPNSQSGVHFMGVFLQVSAFIFSV